QETNISFFVITQRLPSSPPFPYTTLFRSIISNDGSNKLNRSRKARVSYKVQRTINASLNAATSTRAVSSNPNFVGYPRFPAPVRSEERFSRNAETDLVCRLLLQKKNNKSF